MNARDIDLEQLRIRVYPDPVLRHRAEPIREIDGALTALGERMIDLMVAENGVGLAAPQVGVPLRIIVVSFTGQRKDAEVFINPELDQFEGWAEMEEGCLSVPGVRAAVRRPAVCAVRAWDLDANEFVMDATELAATVFQHETDHLDGRLFIDRLGGLAKMAVRRPLRDLERQWPDEA